MKIDIDKLDAHLRFLQTEEKNLRDMHKVWADAKAAKYLAVIELLTELRREHQMTGMNGKRIQ